MAVRRIREKGFLFDTEVDSDEIRYVDVSPTELKYRLKDGRTLVVDCPDGKGLARAFFPHVFEVERLR